MHLQLQGVVRTGTGLLDSGITDIEVAVIDGQVHLYSTTGRNGGIAEFVIGEGGVPVLHSTVIHPPEITAVVSDRLVVADDGSGPVLMIGSRGQALIGYDLQADGELGAQIATDWGDAGDAGVGGSVGHIAALVLVANAPVGLFGSGVDCSQIVELVGATIGGQQFILTACALTNSVTAFRVDPRTGALIAVASEGADTGLGINAPTALEVVQIGGQTFVIVAAAGTSSLSVMRMGADGALVPTDHVVDTGATRFEGVQALGVASVGDQTFVVAGGADSGLTLFMLLPDGTLVAVQSIADSDATAMFRVSAISVAVVGNTLQVFVGAQNEPGLTQFSIDLSGLGSVSQGTAKAETLNGGAGSDILMAVGSGDTLSGGGGDDILVSGTGTTRMTGGAGADIFVVRQAATTTTITDFRAGTDRLDLSDLPMLRDPAQLTFTTTASGAVIEYRGWVVALTSADGRPLTRADVFAQGFDWGDHFPVGPGPAGNVGVKLSGGRRDNLLEGTMLDDTLNGGGGNDTLIGGEGDDSIEGAKGHDLIQVSGGRNILNGGAGRDTIQGGTGKDTISGGGGRDRLEGGDGDDSINGGNGPDRIFGEAGNDSLTGGGGRDLLDGGDGDDSINGGAGRDRIFGGAGNDTIDGGVGGDRIWGGGGHDLVLGGDGPNRINLGAGNDTAYGGAAVDRVDGGCGNDLIYGGGGNDRLLGADGHDRLWGEDGNDRLIGGAGNDMIWGEAGDDTLFGDDGNDWLSGGDGDDVIRAGAGNDVLRGGSGSDRMWGDDGADVFEFFRDHETGRVMDFDPAEGDRLRLDDWIWFSLGDLSAEQVVTRFGSIDGSGSIVLDFSGIGGNVVILDHYDDLQTLANYIEIM